MEVVVQRRSSAPLIFGLLLLLLGTLFLGVVVFRDAPLVLFGVKAGAVVEKVTEEPSRTSSRKSGPSYRLHLLFTLPDGETARFDTLSTWGRTLHAGDEVTIIYHSGPPLRGEVYSARQLWLPLVTGTVVSFACLLGGYFIVRSRFRGGTCRWDLSAVGPALHALAASLRSPPCHLHTSPRMGFR